MESKSPGFKWCDNGEAISMERGKYENTIKKSGYFNLTDHNSFIRQMNLYYFKLIRTENNGKIIVYKHSNFKKDSPDLLINVKRSPQVTVRPSFSKKRKYKRRNVISDTESDTSLDEENCNPQIDEDCYHNLRRSKRIAEIKTKKPKIASEFESKDLDSDFGSNYDSDYDLDIRSDIGHISEYDNDDVDNGVDNVDTDKCNSNNNNDGLENNNGYVSSDNSKDESNLFRRNISFDSAYSTTISFR